MTENWIVEVLEDLRTFTRAKGLDATADVLGEACLLAAAELRLEQAREKREMMDAHARRVGNIPGIAPGG